MAATLHPKAAGETVRYVWKPPVTAGDFLATATPVVDSGTVTLGNFGVGHDEAFFYIAGGALNETAVVTVTVTTTGGATLIETFYVPVRASAAVLGRTVLDVIKYALRPIIGLRADPKPAEQADARENLDLMLAEWAGSGADLGVKMPTAEADVLLVPDEYIGAIKANLRRRLCELYGQPVSATDMRAAIRGEVLVKFNNLPEDRAGVYY